MTNKTVATETAQANANAIRQLWRQGNASLKRIQELEETRPRRLQYGHKAKTFKQEAQTLDISVDTAAKMRRLAEEYSADQIASLCNLVLRHNSPFSGTHLLILLRVEDRQQRDALTKQAIREGWSTSRLERVIQAAKGKRRPHVGRKPRMPADPVEALLTLDALCLKFNGWCDLVLGILPRKVHAPVKAATKAIEEVRSVVAEQLPKVSGKGQEKT